VAHVTGLLHAKCFESGLFVPPGAGCMKIVAISVGGPRQLEWRGRVIHTSIFKTPVASRVHVTRLNIEGDQQADLSVHGGPEKAVYAYPAEHYAYWRTELPNAELCWGAFGENFTTEGLLEDEVCIGDRYRMGTAEFIVTQPRIPCYKLGIRFGRMDMVKRFLRSGRSGFYMAVVREGNVGAGDIIERVTRDERVLTVADIVRLYAADAANQRILECVSEQLALPVGWRDYFRKRLWEPDT
jgi:MOSC domain-containing protein YiiM